MHFLRSIPHVSSERKVPVKAAGVSPDVRRRVHELEQAAAAGGGGGVGGGGGGGDGGGESRPGKPTSARSLITLAPAQTKV